MYWRRLKKSFAISLNNYIRKIGVASVLNTRGGAVSMISFFIDLISIRLLRSDLESIEKERLEGEG